MLTTPMHPTTIIIYTYLIYTHTYVHKKAQTSLLLIYTQRTFELAPTSKYKQQRNLRRYDDIPAQKGRVSTNVIPVGIYHYFVLDWYL